MLRHMLDTHIVIHVIKRRPPEALEVFNRQAEGLCISSITLAELYHGAEKSARPAHNLRAVESFTSRLEVLPYGPKAAMHYGQIRTALERVGRPISENDLHIAAHARSEALTLVTNNTREFARVPALLLDNWVAAA
ncbi:MAG: PIN domain-containing protein [Pseudomonadota bacterium]|nr:PIN domain-containing protein [Pseudomonadota bacterium]